MSALGKYIHYHYNNVSKGHTPADNKAYLASIFNQHLVQQQFTQATDMLDRKIKESYATGFVRITGKEEEEFFNLLNDIQNNVLPKAAEEMSNEIEMPDIMSKELKESLNSISDMQKIIDRYKKVLSGFVDSSFFKNPIPVTTVALLKGDDSSPITEQATKIKEAWREIYLKDKSCFKVDGRYRGAVAQHKDEINKILANIVGFETISGTAVGEVYSSELRSEILRQFMWSTYITINKIIGFISEERLREKLQPLLTKAIKKSLPESSITVTNEGAKRGTAFNKKTEDVSMYISAEALKEGSIDLGELSIKIPGISLKRTNVPKGVSMNRKIQIKKTSFKKLVDSSRSIIGDSELANFYQAYGNYLLGIRKYNDYRTAVGKQQLTKSASQEMYNMYSYFQASFLPTALAGGLTSDDLAYFFVVNKQVYNVAEMIKKMGLTGFNQGIISTFQQQQSSIKNLHQASYVAGPRSYKSGEKRSEAVRTAIDTLPIIMSLLLKVDNS